MSTSGSPTPDNNETATTRIDKGGQVPADRTVPETRPGLNRRDVLALEKEQFGGMKFGSAFFGWLAATGMAVLLTALAAGAGTALGLGRKVNVANPTPNDLQSVGLFGGIALLAIVFIAYYCGGYVAGRMARFSGIRQGIAVWLWAIIIAIVVAVLGAIAGSKYDVLASLNGFPRIPLNEGSLTTAGVLTAVGLALVSLVAAILGGLTGMSFHRRVDKAGLGRRVDKAGLGR